MTIKPAQELISLGPDKSGTVMGHPAQQAHFGRVAELIGWLRACEQPGDFYEFQQRLFGDIHQVEERRAQC